MGVGLLVDLTQPRMQGVARAALRFARRRSAELRDRCREVGLLKATGWGTDEVLLRALSESVAIATLAFGMSFTLSLIGLKYLKGWGLAALFISGLDWGSWIRIPYALSPLTLGVAALATVTVVLTGTLFSAWRAATMSPAEAIRE